MKVYLRHIQCRSNTAVTKPSAGALSCLNSVFCQRSIFLALLVYIRLKRVHWANSASRSLTKWPHTSNTKRRQVDNNAHFFLRCFWCILWLANALQMGHIAPKMPLQVLIIKRIRFVWITCWFECEQVAPYSRLLRHVNVANSMSLYNRHDKEGLQWSYSTSGNHTLEMLMDLKLLKI